LAQAVLTGKYNPGQQPPQDSRAANNSVNGWIKSYFQEEVLQCVQELDHIAGQAGITLSQLAIAWILRQPGVSSALIGASRPSQIEENVKAVEVSLQPDMLEAIEKSLLKVKDFAPMR
jgi:aryl-alcohol dehydrogenase-like predicted oxidoreductase